MVLESLRWDDIDLKYVTRRKFVCAALTDSLTILSYAMPFIHFLSNRPENQPPTPANVVYERVKSKCTSRKQKTKAARLQGK